MKSMVRSATFLLAMTILTAQFGCSSVTTSGGGGPATGTFTLDEDSQEFVVQAGVPAQVRLAGDFDLMGLQAEAGTLEIDLSAITVTATAEDGKGTTNFAPGDVVTVTIDIAGPEDLETVCTEGEEYGPFDITLGENNIPVSVDPSTVELSQNAVDLFNAGQFTICVTVEAPFDATIMVTSFNLSFE
jgi:hypothetical protein